MNVKRVEEIANAVLYEGYILYPYRPSSVKNRQRFNFGVLYPQDYAETHDAGEPWQMRTECLVLGSAETIVEVRVRFLHLVMRTVGDAQVNESWQEAIERDVVFKASVADIVRTGVKQAFDFAGECSESSTQSSSGESQKVIRRQNALCGQVEISAERVMGGIYKVSVQTANLSSESDVEMCNRDEALMRSMVSTHAILRAEGGEFASLLDPSEELQPFAAQCRNIGNWPVLVGDEGQRDAMLASPIILYDYPQIAPESAGEWCDGTEIDEILALRILTMTDEEKQEMRQGDERARKILERTENMPGEHFMKLHGVLRGVRHLDEEAK